MDREQIVRELSNIGYSVLENSPLILKEEGKRICAFGELIIPEVSRYLGKVVLYEMTKNNSQEMLRLEHFLIDKKIPYNHEE